MSTKKCCFGSAVEILYTASNINEKTDCTYEAELLVSLAVLEQVIVGSFNNSIIHKSILNEMLRL